MRFVASLQSLGFISEIYQRDVCSQLLMRIFSPPKKGGTRVSVEEEEHFAIDGQQIEKYFHTRIKMSPDGNFILRRA